MPIVVVLAPSSRRPRAMRAQVSRAGAASRRRVSTSVSARPLGWRLAALVATDFAVCPRLASIARTARTAHTAPHPHTPGRSRDRRSLPCLDVCLSESRPAVDRDVHPQRHVHAPLGHHTVTPPARPRRVSTARRALTHPHPGQRPDHPTPDPHVTTCRTRGQRWQTNPLTSTLLHPPRIIHAREDTDGHGRLVECGLSISPGPLADKSRYAGFQGELLGRSLQSRAFQTSTYHEPRCS